MMYRTEPATPGPQANHTADPPDISYMQVVEALSDSQAFDTSGRRSFALAKGLRYVLHDPEAEAGVAKGAIETVCKLDEVLPRYAGQPLTNEHLLVPHIGGLGDGLVLASCLKALTDKYPDCRIDLPCPPVHHPLLKLVDGDMHIAEYPPRADELKRYAYYMSLEDVDQHAADSSMSNIHIFGQCLRTPQAIEAVKLSLPPLLLEQWDIGTADHPRIGIALTKSSHMRSYPIDLVLELARDLLERKAAVLFFGASAEIQHDLPHAPPSLFNLVDQTPGVDVLAAIFSQIDAVVCPDTLFMHLAGALRVPTLAIFTSSATTVAGGYPTVRTITADAPCRPCGAIADACPLGHGECIVPRQAQLAPQVLAQAVVSMIHSRRPSQATYAGQIPPDPLE